jgi:diguanylate cyclase (GGDEF)-like protein
VIDDNADEAMVLCEGLKLHDYDAESAATGSEGLERCRRGGIDLILLDVALPDLDGYEVCRQLKDNPETRDIIVLFVTAQGAPEDISLGYQLGAVDFITKPFNLPMVMVRVDSAMRTRQMADMFHHPGDGFTDVAYTDHLTGLRNRRFLLERLQEEVEKAHRYDYPVSCMVVDVDEVMAVDDELGATSMDDLLAEIALTMRNASRTYDILARYDGALFAAVLPHARLEDAMSYATKMQREIDATTFSDPSFPTQAKLSFGIVTCRNGSSRGAEHLLGEAMRRLLHAKSSASNLSGRDLNEGH